MGEFNLLNLLTIQSQGVSRALIGGGVGVNIQFLYQLLLTL